MKICVLKPLSLFMSSDYKWPQLRVNVPAPALPWTNHLLAPRGSQKQGFFHLSPPCVTPSKGKKKIIFTFQSHFFKANLYPHSLIIQLKGKILL